MNLTVSGKEGEYYIQNPGLIFQRIYDNFGNKIEKNVIHYTYESIKNEDDRSKVKYKISDFILDQMQQSLLIK